MVIIMKRRILSLLLVLIIALPLSTHILAVGEENYPVPLYSVEDLILLPKTTGFFVSENGKNLYYLAQAKGVLNIFVREIATGKETQLTFETEQHITNFFLKADTLLYMRDTQGDEVYQIYRVNNNGTTTSLTPPGVRALPISFLEDTDADDEILVAMNLEDPQQLNVYRLNILTGEYTRVLDQAMDGLVMDNDGTIRIIIVLDGYQVNMYHRYTDDEEFVLVSEWEIDEFASPVFFDKNNKYVYAASNIGRNTNAVVLLDPATGKELEVIYVNNDVDVEDVIPWKPGVLGLVSYYTDRPHFEFFNNEMKTWYNDVASLFDKNYVIGITSTSSDNNVNVVTTYSDVSFGSTYLVNRKDRSVKLLYDGNSIINPAHMAPMQSVEYTARDGLKIPGYLTLPVGVEPKNLPLVVMPHGGPWLRDYWGFNPEAQFLANRGYAVLQPNFRGSTGYGRKFVQASYGEWGLAMQDDVTDGVLWLIKEGIADPGRVGIYGGSYGGYAALAGAAYTPDLYSAVIDYVGVSNLFTFIDSIPAWWEPQRELFYTRIGHPETDFDRLKATSPVFSADKITAPLFIAHGANDPRVALDESLQIIDALTERGVEVEFYVAWDEGHGFMNDDNREIFYRVMEVFLSEHLGGRTMTKREDLPDPLFDKTPLETWGKSRFDDVPKDSWFYDAIESVCQMGLMQGTGASTFSPNDATTRGMIATILYRMAGSPDMSDFPNPFDDVAEGAWYEDAVKWAVESGIDDGVSDSLFAPNAPSPRQDLAVIFSRFADYVEMELPELQDYTGFKDDADIDSYAAEAVKQLYMAMIINGKPGNVFDPQGSTTRAELATMLVRFIVRPAEQAA
jgi:dipeptidyl aminopeptidase/acylaminoacyl peptidase